MAYKPYKMKGHTLPGIKQREEKKSPNKWVQFIPMALSAISAIQSSKKKKEE